MHKCLLAGFKIKSVPYRRDLVYLIVADVFEFVVSRRALTKNIAQKLEPLDIIHFQAMQSKIINNIKK